MGFKYLTNDQTVLRYRCFNFYTRHNVDGKGFSLQMPTLKTVPSDQKSNRCTCAEECQMHFKFRNFAVRSVLYIVWPSVSSFNNLYIHKTIKVAENICIKE